MIAGITVSANKQVQRTVSDVSRRAASAPFHYAHAVRWRAQPAAAELRRGRHIVRAWLLSVLTISACQSSTEPPLSSGDYVFSHKFTEAEHSNIPSIKVDVQIRGRHIVLTNNDKTEVFPAGVLEEGTLMWHATSGQWIIGTEPTDVDAPEVGGCSDGPAVVDLERRVYWTC